MSELEKKVDALMRFALASNPQEAAAVKEEIAGLLARGGRHREAAHGSAGGYDGAAAAGGAGDA